MEYLLLLLLLYVIINLVMQKYKMQIQKELKIPQAILFSLLRETCFLIVGL